MDLNRTKKNWKPKKSYTSPTIKSYYPDAWTPVKSRTRWRRTVLNLEKRGKPSGVLCPWIWSVVNAKALKVSVRRGLLVFNRTIRSSRSNGRNSTRFAESTKPYCIRGDVMFWPIDRSKRCIVNVLFCARLLWFHWCFYRALFDYYAPSNSPWKHYLSYTTQTVTALSV